MMKTSTGTAAIYLAAMLHLSIVLRASCQLQIVPLQDWTLFSTADVVTEYQITVPNTVVGALLSTPRYPFDPFYGKNLDLIDEQDFLVPWVYRTAVQAPHAAVRAVLRLEGLNYRAHLRINNATVANESVLVGALRRFELDVTDFLRFSVGFVNTIEITVWSQKHCPGQWRNNATDLSINFQDWNPHPPDLSMGLFRPVELIFFSPPPPSSLGSDAIDAEAAFMSIDGFAVSLHIPMGLPGAEYVAYANCSFLVKYWGQRGLSNMSLLLDMGLGSSVPPMLSRGLSFPPRAAGLLDPLETRVYFSWQNYPQLILTNQSALWWPWQMGASPLHTATVETLSSTVVVGSARYGLRQVRQELNEGGSLQFFINNVPIMFRSAGWTSEMFLREKNYERLFNEFSLMLDMGLNGLRLEGMVESNLFYDLADELGLMILPGIACCDGWQHWWEWPEENYDISRRSVVDQARRLSRHASVIGFFESSDNLPPAQLETMYLDAFVQESWPNALISSASQDVSNVTGNPGVKMVGPYSWVPPNYWLVDGNGNADGNYGGAWGFFTEGGPGESPMTYRSWLRTVPEDRMWNTTTQSMDSWWSYHMGEPFGHFRNLTFYTPPLEARYGAGDVPITSAKDYLRRAQAANYEGVRAFMESYSRNKHINATGFVQWLLNNAWPSHLWHLYDFYLVGGGGYYGAKAALEELHLMYSSPDGSVWLINSRFVEFVNVNASMRIVDLRGRVVYTASQSIPVVLPDASFAVEALVVPAAVVSETFAPDDTYFVILTLTYHTVSQPQEQQLHREHWYWLSPTPDVLDFAASNGFRTPCTGFTNFSQLVSTLPLAELSVTANQTSPNSASVSLWSSKNNSHVAFFVRVTLVNVTSGLELAPQLWSDNYVSLVPGAGLTLEVRLPGRMAMVLGTTARVEVEQWGDV